MLTDLKKKYKKGIPCNFIVDNLISSISIDPLKETSGISVKQLNLTDHDYDPWLQAFFPKWKKQFKFKHHKKLLEFYSTYKTLEVKPQENFMDVAGGAESYLGELVCRKKYLQDIIIGDDAREKFGDSVEFLEGDASKIPLPDGSLDKISCHHSFEHFQGDGDNLFIREVQRLLKVGGRCAILPIFLADRFVEITDTFTFDRKFDEAAYPICDPSCMLPGGDDCGNYARVYDLDAFKRRVLSALDLLRFQVTLFEVLMNGEPVPNPHLKCHQKITAINYPYRLLLIEKMSDD